MTATSRMPYKVVHIGSGYEVVTSAGPHKGHKHSKHPLSHTMAEKQMKALYYHIKGKK